MRYDIDDEVAERRLDKIQRLDPQSLEALVPEQWRLGVGEQDGGQRVLVPGENQPEEVVGARGAVEVEGDIAGPRGTSCSQRGVDRS